MKKLDSLNQYLAILAKLNRNKISIGIIFLLAIFSCNFKPRVSSRIICPEGSDVTVRFAYAKDTVKGIRDFYDIKQRQHTSEKYTVIKYPDGRFVQIKIAPEVMINCRVIEIKGDVKGVSVN